MKILLQRVTEAHVEVDQRTVGAIEQGLLLLVGLQKQDTPQTLKRMAERVLGYRVFSDDQGKMNLSVRDIQGGILAVSQFTLAADTQKGLRPGFSVAAPPEQATVMFDQFIEALEALHSPIAKGIFGADMKVALVNDGPVTFMLEG